MAVKKTTEVDVVVEITEEAWQELIDRVAALEAEMSETQKVIPVAKKHSGRVWTDEERQAAGLRLQTARALKLGLESAEQMRSLHLKPGQTPTKAQVLEAKKAHPVLKVSKVDTAK